jgi:hypothetical protein
MNREFFLCSLQGCLPALTDLVIDAATLAQRAEIEEELFKLRLKRKCFMALAERVPQAVFVFPASGSDSADFRSPGCRAPFDHFGVPAPGVQVVSPAETHWPDSICPEQEGREAAPAENGATEKGKR